MKIRPSLFGQIIQTPVLVLAVVYIWLYGWAPVTGFNFCFTMSPASKTMRKNDAIFLAIIMKTSIFAVLCALAFADGGENHGDSPVTTSVQAVVPKSTTTMPANGDHSGHDHDHGTSMTIAVATAAPAPTSNSASAAYPLGILALLTLF